MRGTPQRGGCLRLRNGIIPAYAGNTIRTRSDTASSRDHPRVCGEHEWSKMTKESVSGSSPRMRGTLRAPTGRSLHVGIIPAYAGNTYNPYPCGTGDRDHPRVCGEHSSIARATSLRPGSSPRMRGTQRQSFRSDFRIGIIPAYAGNTGGERIVDDGLWDHPRVCGEHYWIGISHVFSWGSSPRMRGTLTLSTSTLTLYGIIPAYAGNTPNWRTHPS